MSKRTKEENEKIYKELNKRTHNTLKEFARLSDTWIEKEKAKPGNLKGNFTQSKTVVSSIDHEEMMFTAAANETIRFMFDEIFDSPDKVYEESIRLAELETKMFEMAQKEGFHLEELFCVAQRIADACRQDVVKRLGIRPADNQESNSLTEFMKEQVQASTDHGDCDCSFCTMAEEIGIDRSGDMSAIDTKRLVEKFVEDQESRTRELGQGESKRDKEKKPRPN